MSIVSLQGRTLDSGLIDSEEARKFTKREYKKEFDKKKAIDKINEKRPSN